MAFKSVDVQDRITAIRFAEMFLSRVWHNYACIAIIILVNMFQSGRHAVCLMRSMIKMPQGNSHSVERNTTSTMKNVLSSWTYETRKSGVDIVHDYVKNRQSFFYPDLSFITKQTKKNKNKKRLDIIHQTKNHMITPFQILLLFFFFFFFFFFFL